MYNFDKPIYILDRYAKSDGSAGFQFLTFSEYQKLIAVNNLESGIVSEISIMIRYKGYTPLGYVQILSDKELSASDFNTANITANSISKEIIASGFSRIQEKCNVDNISMQGVGFFIISLFSFPEVLQWEKLFYLTSIFLRKVRERFAR